MPVAPAAASTRLGDRPSPVRSPQFNLPQLADLTALNIQLLDTQALSPDRVDDLIEAQQDWIGMLHADWLVERQHWQSSVNSAVVPQCTTECMTLNAYIEAIAPHDYRAMAIACHLVWSHTRCVTILGLGRVRLLVLCDAPQQPTSMVAFATNRLHWTPRQLVHYWLLEHNEAWKQVLRSR
ncbi:MAG: hypothetical protein KME20_03360 [Kaiparowitsia implicata GSE-PSE-MK54-09C]|jgi:hypothetical protein|nr:hypothetical protein [Kaiparowitsia implicata GSE-PSE-MK54-09C]